MADTKTLREAHDPLNVIGEAFGIGKDARTLDVILANIENAKRRAACLSAIEREFFTHEVPGDDGEDEPHDECMLNWGDEPDEYITRFRAALAAQAQAEPVQRVYLVCTGETHNGQETYTRHDDAPPPLCDAECLYTAPQPAAQPVACTASHLCDCQEAGQPCARKPAAQPVEQVAVPDGLSRSDAQFWLDRRVGIIEAFRREGYTIVTTVHGIRLVKKWPQEDPGELFNGLTKDETLQTASMAGLVHQAAGAPTFEAVPIEGCAPPVIAGMMPDQVAAPSAVLTHDQVRESALDVLAQDSGNSYHVNAVEELCRRLGVTL